MKEQIDNLTQQVEELTNRLNVLSSSTTLPLEVVEAMRKRLQPVSGDSNSTSPITTSINEGGSATKTVASPMTGFITIVVNGNSVSVPYY